MLVKVRKIISQTTKEQLNHSPWIQLDKEYLVLALFVVPNYGISVYIQTENDHQPRFFLLDGIEMVSQHLPSNWKMFITSGNIVKLIPEPWNYETFFEDLEDGDLKAVALFNQEAEKIYEEENWVFE